MNQIDLKKAKKRIEYLIVHKENKLKEINNLNKIINELTLAIEETDLELEKIKGEYNV